MSLNRVHQHSNRAVRNHLCAGGILAAVLLVGIGGWACIASIESAVIAPATVVIEGSRKAVQHDAGGIIKSILVKDGDVVQRDQILFILDDVQLGTEIAAIKKRIFIDNARRYRLEAERLGLDHFNVPAALQRRAEEEPELEKILNIQQELFVSRNLLRHGKQQQLSSRIAQLHQEIRGLKEVRDATREQLSLFNVEVAQLSTLRSRQLINQARYSAIRRAAAEKRGVLGRTVAQIARAQDRVVETQQQIAEIKLARKEELLKELETIDGELSQTTEKLRLARSRFTRLKVRASVEGIIHELSVHTVGGVVGAGDTLASIVPLKGKLIVDAKVQTNDRDQIWAGMPARVRFSAFNQGTTPELVGRVEQIASDQSEPKEGSTPFYAVRIKLRSDQIPTSLGMAKLVAGMPAEVLMTSGPRTVMSYLSKPLTDQFNRAFRDE